MPWWGWLSVAIAVWLFMARWSMRWCRELEPDTDPEPHLILSLLFPCFTILGLFPLCIGSTQIGGDGPPYYPMARAIVGGLIFSTIITLLQARPSAT